MYLNSIKIKLKIVHRRGMQIYVINYILRGDELSKDQLIDQSDRASIHTHTHTHTHMHTYLKSRPFVQLRQVISCENA
jgi:hypothetical protein